MRIYTKTGDDGMTSLGAGKRAAKHDPYVTCLGNLDELNSNIGYLIALINEQRESFRLCDNLQRIQHTLFDIGSGIIGVHPYGDKIHEYMEAELIFLESEIDKMQAALPPLKQFILPGGCKVSAYVHVVRSVCRRAERSVVALLCQEEKLAQNKPNAQTASVLKYINRLSDFFFVLARCCQKDDELYWKKMNHGASACTGSASKTTEKYQKKWFTSWFTWSPHFA